MKTRVPDTNANASPRERVIGAAAVFVLGAVLAVVGALATAVAGHGPVTAPDALSPSLLFPLVVAALMGAAVAPRLLRANRIGAIGGGILWVLGSLVAISFVSGLGGLIDLWLREKVSMDAVWQSFASSLLVLLVWGLPVILPVSLAVGLLWAAIGRLLNRLVRNLRGPQVPASRVSFGRVLLASILLMPIGLGLTVSRATQPPGSRCLPIIGERPLSGAWSPDGRLLAIASAAGPNAEGHVRLFSWPLGDLVATWDAWVEDEQTLAVDDAGRAYWTTAVLQPPWDEGIQAAAPGGAPTWLIRKGGPEEVLLWDLTWSAGELRAQTANSHVAVHLPLSGPDEGRIIPVDWPSPPIGAVWWSADGAWGLSTVEWQGTAVAVRGPDGSVELVPAPDDLRTISMTPDRSAIVASSWGGSSRIIDVTSGSARAILAGIQRWIVVSSKGDVAWANDEEQVSGQACVLPLQTLNGG
jgi:hypothetical protein